jgi:hypothetical protein
MGISKSKFPKIIVSKDYEIENGMLGLERDVYLSIAKFLGSSILRIILTNETHSFRDLQTRDKRRLTPKRSISNDSMEMEIFPESRLIHIKTNQKRIQTT